MLQIVGICQTNQTVWKLILQWWTMIHDDVINWKHFPRFWPFLRGSHRRTMDSPHKHQWHGALMLSLICAWKKRLTNQSRRRWFESPLRSLWRRRDASHLFHPQRYWLPPVSTPDDVDNKGRAEYTGHHQRHVTGVVDTWKDTRHTWRRHNVGILSALLGLCEGNPPVTSGVPSQRSTNAALFLLLVVTLHKQSVCLWFSNAHVPCAMTVMSETDSWWEVSKWPHWGRDKLAAISYTIFSNSRFGLGVCVFRIKFICKFFLRAQSITSHWFR